MDFWNQQQDANTQQTIALARRRQRRAHQRGLTLIEILVVVAILGLIAGVVGVTVVNAMTDAQIKTTQVQVGELQKSLDMYKIRSNRYPSTAEGLQALTAGTNGQKPIMETLPKDAWGHDFIYVQPGQKNPHKFDLSSSGPDEQAGTDDDISNWKSAQGQ